jgi:hypothetical protein
LLDFRIQANLDNSPLVVNFTPDYENGRWARRTATTLKSWFVTEKPMKHEVALKWTDNRAQKLSRNVVVQYLVPGRPLLMQRAMIIAGDGIGLTGTVGPRIRGTKTVLFRYDGTATDFIIPDSDLCRVADPEVLSISEVPS